MGAEGSGPLQFYYPRDIAINSASKRFYVVEEGNHRIQILNFDLSTFVFSFGKKGSGFKCPSSVTFDSTGNAYVADFNNHRIQVFTAKEKFLRMFGGMVREDVSWIVLLVLPLTLVT